MEVMITNAFVFHNWKVSLASIWDQRLLQPLRSILWPSMLWHCVTWEMGTKVLQEPTAAMYGLPYTSDRDSIMLLWNISTNLPDYTVHNL